MWQRLQDANAAERLTRASPAAVAVVSAAESAANDDAEDESSSSSCSDIETPVSKKSRYRAILYPVQIAQPNVSGRVSWVSK